MYSYLYKLYFDACGFISFLSDIYMKFLFSALFPTHRLRKSIRHLCHMSIIYSHMTCCLAPWSSWNYPRKFKTLYRAHGHLRRSARWQVRSICGWIFSLMEVIENQFGFPQDHDDWKMSIRHKRFLFTGNVLILNAHYFSKDGLVI